MSEACPPPASARATQRFNQLPPAVRGMLAELNDADVATLKRVIELFRDMHGWCRISKWIFIGALSAAIILAQGVNAIRDLIAAILRAMGKN